ncbi:MAG TPA: hypothetical protein VFV50_13445 [Bdellovibrionales bacterium]|nr:hypothetical protein [Bdellovibrionales bacterium]
MKQTFFAAILGVLTLSSTAFAQWGGSLTQEVQALRQDTRQLDRMINRSNLDFQTKMNAEQLVRQADNLSECLLLQDDGFNGRPGRPERPNRPDRPDRGCEAVAQRAQMTLSQIERQTVYAAPRIRQQVRQTRQSLNRVIAASQDQGGTKLVARGEMNRVRFDLRGNRPQNILNKCLRFADEYRIRRVYDLVVNGRRININNASAEEACQVVARAAQ